jgi:lipopolysaccharide/colanic/teichoic acid biosynthesis glycosyltransferase
MTDTLNEAPLLSRAKSGNGSAQTFDFSPWHDLPGLPGLPRTMSAPGTVKEHTVGPLARLCAALILIPALPLMALVALAIKLESPGGPVFYRQVRVGLDRRRRTNGSSPAGPPDEAGERRRNGGHGKPFMIWKFRTMRPDAETATGPVWATDRDPRVTRVGRVLRHLRLDEVPQVFNVLAGQMSLIGPRPERPFFVSRLTREMPDYPRRLAVPPGITGLAQVEKQYDASVSDVRTKLGYDIFYVDNKCRLLDFKILLKTVDVVLRGRGAK